MPSTRIKHEPVLARLRVLLLTVVAGAAAFLLSVGLPPLCARAQAQANGIEGTWQGTLHVPNGQQLRTVVKITRDNKDMLKSTFYSIDQGGTGIGVDKTTFQGSELSLSIDRLDLTYSGKMSADGKSIDGASTQGGTQLPLILERATPAMEWTIPEPPKPIPSMDPKADPSLEVATIKPSKPDTPGKGFGFRGGKFMTVNFTLGEMISTAYGVQQKQVIGAPDWVYTDKFDIQGTPDTPGMPSRAQLMGEVQKLMADRFQLKFHRENKELSAFLLSTAKGGSRLKQNAPNPDARPGLFFTGVGSLRCSNVTLADFSSFLQSAVLDRPVVNQTGLPGEYDFTLKWTPDEAQLAQMGMKAPATEPAEAQPNLFTALSEELGLRLESGKAPVPVLVIDKVEKPSDN